MTDEEDFMKWLSNELGITEVFSSEDLATAEMHMYLTDLCDKKYMNPILSIVRSMRLACEQLPEKTPQLLGSFHAENTKNGERSPTYVIGYGKKGFFMFDEGWADSLSELYRLMEIHRCEETIPIFVEKEVITL